MRNIAKPKSSVVETPRLPLQRGALFTPHRPKTKPPLRFRDAWQAPLATKPDAPLWGASVNNVLATPQKLSAKSPMPMHHHALTTSAEIAQLAKKRQNPLLAQSAAQRLKAIINHLNGPHFVQEIHCELSIAAFAALLKTPDFATFQYACDFARRAHNPLRSVAKLDKLGLAAQQDYEAYILALCKQAFSQQLHQAAFYVQVKAYMQHLMTSELNTLTQKYAATQALAPLLDTEIQLKLWADLFKSHQLPILTRICLFYRFIAVIKTCYSAKGLAI